MTTETDHGLVCLDGDDYAAIALAMQKDALATDAALDAVSDAFDTNYLRPVVLAATTGISGPNSTLGEIQFNLATLAIGYFNFTPAPTAASANSIRMTAPRTGWYSYGAFMNMAATGAVTAFSRRTIFVTASRIISGIATTLSQIRSGTVDTNTAGEFLIASGGTFYATAGTTVDVKPTWSHANAASTVQVNAGAKVWIHWTGSGVETGSI